MQLLKLLGSVGDSRTAPQLRICTKQTLWKTRWAVTREHPLSTPGVFSQKVFLLLLFFGVSYCLSERKHRMGVGAIQTPGMFLHFISLFAYLHLLWRPPFE